MLSLVSGCAPARAPVTTPDTTIDDADARVREGCYDCLLDARERYRALNEGQSWPTIVRRLFEVELLIAMRERELGSTPPRPWLLRLRSRVRCLQPIRLSDTSPRLSRSRISGTGGPAASSQRFVRLAG